MKDVLEILHVEDNPRDAELIKRIIQGGGIKCRITWVMAPGSFREALEGREFDLILSDYTLPAFSGLAALKLAREKTPHCPVIFVSGTIGEETAIEALKHGAADYVLKDRLVRLPIAVRRAVEEAEREKQKQRVEARTAEQAALLDAAQEAILAADLEGCIHYWSKGAERLHGWNAEEVLGRKTTEFLYKGPSWPPEALQMLLEKGEWSGEVTTRTKQGREVLVQAHWSLVRDESRRPKSILSINTDITQKKKLEAQFLRAQRLQTIGALVGGIAHDLNNLLAPILLGAGLLQEELTDEEHRRMLHTMHVSARRGAEMVEQILSFARGVSAEKATLEVKALITEMERLVKAVFPKSIQLQTEISENLKKISGNLTQLHQVLLNLLVNARDAMPNGGCLHIGAHNLDLENKPTWSLTAPVSGSYVLLTVSDSGQGIPPEQSRKIFDPFFTTKPGGTGLGLSTVLSIVKNHGGFVEVESDPGKGTSFQVFLPAVASAEPQNPPSMLEALPTGRGETILVIDDETALLELSRETLEAFNYRVLAASDGAKAISLYEPRKDEIGLVISDMMMPVMDGPATIRSLQAINPAVKIIGMSGFDPKVASAQCAELGVREFLKKPFTTKTLLTTLRRVLDQNSLE